MDDPNSELKDLYATTEDRIDTLLDRSDVAFWRALRKAMSDTGLKDPEEVMHYVVEEFGVQLEMSKNSAGLGFVPRAEIVDEQKYLIFLLKYQS